MLHDDAIRQIVRDRAAERLAAAASERIAGRVRVRRLRAPHTPAALRLRPAPRG